MAKINYDIRKTKFFKDYKEYSKGWIVSYVRFNFQGLVEFIGCEFTHYPKTITVEPKRETDGKIKFNVLFAGNIDKSQYRLSFNQMKKLIFENI